jgi:murein L,D-transpeptidase YafK
MAEGMTRAILASAMIGTALSCSGDEARKPLPREEAAAQRVRPALKRDLKAAGLHFGDPVFLRAFKEERVLEVFVRRREQGKFALFRSYPIAAASGRPGPKLREGDGQVPEGFYYVPPSAMKPDSIYHLAFNIGYPNAYDRAHGRTGSHIMIHGNRVSIGCLAMTDAKIEEIYTLCAAAHANGQKFFRVHLFPFRMTDERMRREGDSEWIGFWRNLKQGHDWFEEKGLPPDVTVKDGVYHFGD